MDNREQQQQYPQQQPIEGEYRVLQDKTTYVVRGDSFDIGSGSGQPQIQNQNAIAQFMSNPSGLATLLGLTQVQAENIKSLIVGGGAGGIHKLLSRYLGDEFAGAVGGLVAGYIAKRLIR